MNSTMTGGLSFLAGVGVGAGLMYVLDPQMGQRRRAQARDQVEELWKESREGVESLAQDVGKRASGVVSALQQQVQEQVQEHWTPTTRLVTELLGGGLIAFGLTQRAPTACIFGTVGAAVLACGVTNLPEVVRS